LEKQTKKMRVSTAKILLYAIDAVAINLAYFIAIFLQYYSSYQDSFLLIISGLLVRSIIVTIGYLAIFKLFNLYDSIWQYAGVYELFQCVAAVIIGGILSIGIDRTGNYLLHNIATFRASIYINSTLILIALIGGIRLVYRAFARRNKKNVDIGEIKRDKRVMVVGAGSMGMIMIEDLQANGYRLGRPVVVVDDNINKQGKRLRGIPVRGGCENIPELAKQYKVDEITLCIPAASPERQIEILKIAMETGCILKTSPSLLEMSGDKNARKIRNVEK